MPSGPTEHVDAAWMHPDGKLVRVRVYLVDYAGRPSMRGAFDSQVWRPALRRAVSRPPRDHGMHALRHLYASVLLDAGESVKALAQYLGPSDPGFTLRFYTRLMPTSHERTRRALNALLAA
jgi:integrase